MSPDLLNDVHWVKNILFSKTGHSAIGHEVILLAGAFLATVHSFKMKILMSFSHFFAVMMQCLYFSTDVLLFCAGRNTMPPAS